MITPLDAVGLFASVVTIRDSSSARFNNFKNRNIENKLNNLDVDIDLSKISEFDGEQLKQYFLKFQKDELGGTLFSEQQQQAFCQKFFDLNPGYKDNKEAIKEILIDYLRLFEDNLRKSMSTEGLILFSRQTETMEMLVELEDSNCKENSETRRVVVEKSDEIKQKLDKVDDKLSTFIDEHHNASTVSDIYRTSQLYAEAFEKVMFLHDSEKDTKVTLANLYVKPICEDDQHHKLTLQERLSTFVHESNEHFLLVEGNAGNGKTTLVEWLNYHKQKNTPEVLELLNGRSIVTVRLRDVEKKTLDQGLIDVIRNYLGKDTPLEDEQLTHILKNNLLVLDGFDELCTIDGIKEPDKVLGEFSRILSSNRLSVKILVTSRPHYIKPLENTWKRVALLSFNKTQIDEWCCKYETACGQAIADHIKSYIHGLHDSKETLGILGLPMTLYMIASKAPGEIALTNEWLLYHTVFYKDIRDTQYNLMTADSELTDSSHPSRDYWDIYYRINEEIAYHIYQTGFSKLYVTSEEIKDIIDQLSCEEPQLKVETVKEISKRCHALCGYWKINTENGCLEFYHNNICVFFLCEKIYRSINALYASNDWSDEQSAATLIQLFQYGHISVKNYEGRGDISFQIYVFLLGRAYCGKLNLATHCNKDFPRLEYELSHFPRLFQTLMTEGNLFLKSKIKDRLMDRGVTNQLEFTANEVFCLLNVFNQVIYPFLEKSQRFHLWKKVDVVNKIEIFMQSLRIRLPQALFLMQSDLHCVSLRRTNLTGAILTGADLTKADLVNADLTNADLIGAILTGADLTRANLVNSDLTDADLTGAILTGADLTGANLTGAILTGAILTRADLTGADLTRADLTMADLTGANYTI